MSEFSDKLSQKTDTSLDLKSPGKKCSVHIKVGPGSAEYEIETETPPLPDWVESIFWDNHLSGYKINRPHTVISKEKCWRCNDDPDKLFVITNRFVDGVIHMEGGLLELSFPRGDTTFTVDWQRGKRENKLIFTCTDVAGRNHRLVIVEDVFSKPKMLYVVE